MTLPMAICEGTPSSQTRGLVILIVVAVVYLGLLVIAVWGARPGARLRVAATWLLSAAGVSLVLVALEADSGATDAGIVLAAAGIALVVTVSGIRARKTERVWPHVVAGAIGGITPFAFVLALFAWVFANGGCLD